jgi:hypothetical protein
LQQRLGAQCVTATTSGKNTGHAKKMFRESGPETPGKAQKWKYVDDEERQKRISIRRGCKRMHGREILRKAASDLGLDEEKSVDNRISVV